jgi:hypothetical protein
LFLPNVKALLLLGLSFSSSKDLDYSAINKQAVTARVVVLLAVLLRGAFKAVMLSLPFFSALASLCFHY